MYVALSRHDCDAVDGAWPVISAAADACLAAGGADDAETRWQRAADVRDAANPSSLDCMDAMAYALLDALVDAHQAFPELPFRFGTGDSLGKSTCLAISSVDPASGTSGDEVVVRGVNMDRATAVRLVANGSSKQTAQIIAASYGELRIKLPAKIERSGHNLVVAWTEPTGESLTWVPFGFSPGAAPQDPDSPAPSTDETSAGSGT
jgi:hypothetical protein